MILAATLFFAALCAAAAARVPRPLITRYCNSFRARHGVGMQISLTVLGTVLFSAVLATALEPGHLAMELLNAAVVFGLAWAARNDLRRFSRPAGR